jgi:hypothetical protein
MSRLLRIALFALPLILTPTLTLAAGHTCCCCQDHVCCDDACAGCCCKN